MNSWLLEYFTLGFKLLVPLKCTAYMRNFGDDNCVNPGSTNYFPLITKGITDGGIRDD